jgi:hypothetical protein
VEGLEQMVSHELYRDWASYCGTLVAREGYRSANVVQGRLFSQVFVAGQAFVLANRAHH